jgi:hypothetical protein
LPVGGGSHGLLDVGGGHNPIDCCSVGLLVVVAVGGGCWLVSGDQVACLLLPLGVWCRSSCCCSIW